MYREGQRVANKYLVEGNCSDSGGMGALLFVRRVDEPQGELLVLKVCRGDGEEILKRFRREVRLLSEYQGNSKVVQVVDWDVDHEPPFFVMKYYSDGDLTNTSTQLVADFQKQENIFLQMIDCVAELHARDHFHRDIKPQNFLLDDGVVVLSDFGLGMELESKTGFTRSSVYWGTVGYLPPEFTEDGGFKNASAASDIFMLGKSFYALLTGRDPQYIQGDDLPDPIFQVIGRACAIAPAQRYQSLAELKQALVMAFDVLLKRGGGLGEVRQVFSSIVGRIEQSNQYSAQQVCQFVEKLSMIEQDQRIQICLELDRRMFLIFRQDSVVEVLPRLLQAYSEMVASERYGWSFAEEVASNMRVVFDGDAVATAEKCKALEIAIDAASRMNRFAAMDICTAMVQSVDQENLGMAVAAIILGNKDRFITETEASPCKSASIINALLAIKKEDSEEALPEE